MKNIISTSLILFLFFCSSYGQKIKKIEKPDSVTAESTFKLMPSSVFIPIKVNQTYLKTLIDNATPTSQQISDNSTTQEFNVSINIIDKETKFNGTNITHYARLTGGNGYIKKRTCWSTPIGNGCSPWVRLDCNDISGNASISIQASLNADFTITSTSKLKTEIDNVECAQLNVTGILRAFGWNDFEQEVTQNINTELNKIGIKKQVTEIWKKVQVPYKVSDDFYLLIKPKEILYKDLFFEKGYAKTGIGLNFYATTGNSADSAKWKINIPLPNLVKNPIIKNNNIELNLPINLPYTLLDKTAKEKLIGETIEVKKKNGKKKKYATILDVEIYGSKETDYDIVLGLKTKIDRTIFKREIVPIFLHAKLGYDTMQKKLYVTSYKIDSKTESGLFNISVQALANKIVYTKVLTKLQFEVGKAIDEQKKIANKLLKDKIEITKGVKLSGVVNTLEIKALIPQPDRIFCLFSLKGNANVEVLEIKQ